MRTIAAIYKTRSISGAANAIGLTSPAVTIQLQQLEEALGNQLFVRTRSGVQPTAIGDIVIAFCQQTLADIDTLEDTIKRYQSGKFGRLSLGVVSTGKYFAPKLIAAFNKEHPGIDISLFVANRIKVIQMLKEHEIDLALMGRPPTEFKVHAAIFGDHPMVVIASADHPLCHKRDITRAALLDYKFIVREKGSGTRTAFQYFMSDLPDAHKLKSIEMDSNETIKQAVIADLGIAFLSAHTVEQECQSGKIVVLDVEDTPVRKQWFSIRNATRLASPAVNSFAQFLKLKGLSLLPHTAKTYPTASPPEDVNFSMSSFHGNDDML